MLARLARQWPERASAPPWPVAARVGTLQRWQKQYLTPAHNFCILANHQGARGLLLAKLVLVIRRVTESYALHCMSYAPPSEDVGALDDRRLCGKQSESRSSLDQVTVTGTSYRCILALCSLAFEPSSHRRAHW